MDLVPIRWARASGSKYTLTQAVPPALSSRTMPRLGSMRKRGRSRWLIVAAYHVACSASVTGWRLALIATFSGRFFQAKTRQQSASVAGRRLTASGIAPTPPSLRENSASSDGESRILSYAFDCLGHLRLYDLLPPSPGGQGSTDAFLCIAVFFFRLQRRPRHRIDYALCV